MKPAEWTDEQWHAWFCHAMQNAEVKRESFISADMTCTGKDLEKVLGVKLVVDDTMPDKP